MVEVAVVIVGVVVELEIHDVFGDRRWSLTVHLAHERGCTVGGADVISNHPDAGQRRAGKTSQLLHSGRSGPTLVEAECIIGGELYGVRRTQYQ